jgi:outer membrane protein OmpA-like peptidoglycan-associated protein
MKLWLVFLILLTSFRLFAQQKNDTFSVYFDLDVPELNKIANSTLDSLIRRKQINLQKQTAIIGYADYLATDEYNLELSHKRAENVKAKLVTAGLKSTNITMLIGKGEVKRVDTVHKNKGVPTDRRVDIVMLNKPLPPKKISDTVVVMHPKNKNAIPPSSDDPNFDIDDIPKGKTFILKNIYFPMGRHFPKQNSLEELNKLLEALKENPNLIIQIEGHVCCVTNVADAMDLDSHQLDLSVNRARFIFEYLVTRGISADRLTYIGFGRSKPIIEDEQTAEEAAINRRVEIRIMDR